MREIGGWWLPAKDGYFDRYVEGSSFKANGFQREHLEEALKFVKAWDCAIDVGAHIGFWTVPMAHKFAKVWAFEPAHDCFSCLLKNVFEFGAKVVPIMKAVGDKEDTVRLCEDPHPKRVGNTGARFVQKDSKGGIGMVSLDSFSFEACDFLKIDVEGFEHKVLRGAKKLIEKFRPVISMETDKQFAWTRYLIPNTEAEHFLLKRDYRVAAHMRPDKVFVPD